MLQYQVIENYAEDIPEMPPDPKTGRDADDIPKGGPETMTVNIRVAGGVTHEGDMGRLGKSE